MYTYLFSVLCNLQMNNFKQVNIFSWDMLEPEIVCKYNLPQANVFTNIKYVICIVGYAKIFSLYKKKKYSGSDGEYALSLSIFFLTLTIVLYLHVYTYVYIHNFLIHFIT